MLDLIEKKTVNELDPSKAQQIREMFEPMVGMLEEMEGQYAEVMKLEQSPEKSALAKRLRIEIAKVRIEADKVRKAQKQQYLIAGNAIQGAFNILKYAVTDKEEALKEVETYYERLEEERLQKIREERGQQLEELEYVLPGVDLASVSDEDFEKILGQARVNHKALIEEREKEERERLENERLDKEYRDRREKAARYARYGSLDHVYRGMPDHEFNELIENMELKEQEEVQRQREIEEENKRLAAERKKQDEEMRREREKRDKLEKAEAERKRIAAEEARKLKTATDKEKLLLAAQQVLGFVDTVSTDEAVAAIREAYSVLSKAAGEL